MRVQEVGDSNPPVPSHILRIGAWLAFDFLCHPTNFPNSKKIGIIFKPKKSDLLSARLIWAELYCSTAYVTTFLRMCHNKINLLQALDSFKYCIPLMKNIS